MVGQASLFVGSNRVEREPEVTWDAQIRANKLELFTSKYYAACAVGGMISAGSVHLLITPLDMLKANPLKYRSIMSGFGIVYREQGIGGIWKGWSSKLFGYGAQGACKFGLYEYFKKFYADLAGPEFTKENKTAIFAAGSLSAQVIADVALNPFESVKVKVQTGYAKGLVDGFPRLYRAEGLAGLYRGLPLLWGRNIPFSVLMFSTFEHSVDFLYKNVLQRPKNDCSRIQQLGITCMAGYMSGVTGTIISNPADILITTVNKNRKLSMVQAAKRIGVTGLFTRSLPLRIMIVGPMATAQWLCYDTLKVLVGLPTSGGIEQFVEVD
ncbi:mitochondrial phosphate carrier protein 1, mitochondrial isoform X2 [Physcomitrium patens]|uniref:mitochondrial phosphate carrier protein 1, mitochondrial isoform X2 n=1 Tax=Physcomitrium patens TaxID=3218 RepID=UPI000D175526|nr:mitochondrial phosphate carrier protein 1, mitochondrial-like isoform X2 [Physcomitrium patens]|eukprot:XP_024383587.1 mitochondrial phosphate carrier protein 1, mitochondrial-like isoform X2 [Physcomitrella patens]